MISAKDELRHLAESLDEGDAERVLALLHRRMPYLFESEADDPFEVLSCHYCQAKCERGMAIDLGWAPSFYRGEEEVNEPVCLACLITRCEFNQEFGDWSERTDLAEPVIREVKP
jgi:hypothetical protein